MNPHTPGNCCCVDDGIRTHDAQTIANCLAVSAFRSVSTLSLSVTPPQQWHHSVIFCQCNPKIRLRRRDLDDPSRRLSRAPHWWLWIGAGEWKGADEAPCEGVPGGEWLIRVVSWPCGSGFRGERVFEASGSGIECDAGWCGWSGDVVSRDDGGDGCS